MARKSTETTSDSDPATEDLLDTNDDEGWEDADAESDVEERMFVSLFDDKVFGTITEMLKYCKDNYDFNYVKLKRQLSEHLSPPTKLHPDIDNESDLDFLDRVQLINYVRSEVAAGRGAQLPKVWTTSSFEDEAYLKPVIQDDPVLYSLDDIDESQFETSEAAPEDPKEAEVQDLRERLAQLQIQYAAYREEVQVSFQKRIDKIPDREPSPPLGESSAKPHQKSSQEDQDSSYFTSYAPPTIHSTMLSDTIRTSAYRDFIYDHKALFAGKTVLDVGCGTGILSLFCAKAGAKSVIAVDNSDIIDKARVIVYTNRYQDTIKCLRGKIEDVVLPVEKVDVIVSEWMGYGLLYESMLDSVLWARDRYLAADGLMVPSHATLRLAPLVASDLRVEHVDFWRDVYGFDMSCMLEKGFDEAIVRTVDKSDVGGVSVPVLELDLHTVKPSELTFLHDFEIGWGGEEGQSLDGWVVWFDMFLYQSRNEGPVKGEEAADAAKKGVVAFSTGPGAKETHWQQVALLTKNQELGLKKGDVVKGKIGYQKKEGRDRSVDIEIIWSVREGGKEERQVWTLD
jgi:type I protein arginine methyltransferase